LRAVPPPTGARGHGSPLESASGERRAWAGNLSPTAPRSLTNDAIGLFKDNLVAAERVHGLDGDATLVFRNNLALGYQHAGHYAQATGLHEENIIHTERRHGRNHLETIGRRNNLAATVALAGYRERAIALYWEILDDMDAMSRDQHLAITARQNLAILHNPAWEP
jgi:hypothetical protein